MMAEREVIVSHTTIMRWVLQYVPEYERRWARFARPPGGSWRVDETAVSVGLLEQDFHLVLWPGTPGKAEPVYGRSPATCTIEVPDIRKAFEELKAKGVQFETEVLEYPWGWVAVFLDLDGNRLQVRHGR